MILGRPGRLDQALFVESSRPQTFGDQLPAANITFIIGRGARVPHGVRQEGTGWSLSRELLAADTWVC
jgi:hypothetical protein